RKGRGMSMHATGTHDMKTWDEKTWDGKPANEVSGAKLTRASVTNSFHGDIEGEGTLEYLMTYRDDGSASYVGLERVVGSVGGRSGSFVLQGIGTFKDGVATVTLIVVPGSGTRDLRGMRGEGGFSVGHKPPYAMTLDYGFEGYI